MTENKSNRKNRGFSLAEVMVAVLILVLLTAVVGAILPLAHNAYTEVVDAGNAEVLSSTTVTELQTRLSLTTEVLTPKEGDTFLIAFKDEDGSKWYRISNDGTNGIVIGQMIVDLDGEYHQAEGLVSRQLVTNKAATEHLYTTAESISYDESSGLFTVTNLEVKNFNGKTLASVESYCIRAINSVSTAGQA